MFKTISAALLAVSVLAAPAFASTARTATAVKPATARTSVLNANAGMGRHHHKYVRHYHHRQHKVAVIKNHAKIGFRHTAPISHKRG